MEQTLSRIREVCTNGATGPAAFCSFLFDLVYASALALSFVILMGGLSLALGGAE